MPRPIYETDKDLDEESKLALKLAKGRQIVKLEKLFAADYALMKTDGKRVEKFLECKRRHNASDKYPTYFISAKKIESLCSLAMATGLNTFIGVQWDDVHGVMSVMTKPDGCVIGGRADRDDEQDTELMLEYNLSSFHIVAVESSDSDAE